MNQSPLFYGQLIVGSAGSGKSTYCKAVQEMGENLRRNILVVNLDPAAENFYYKCDLDIRELISVEDVMEELKLGPNGGLIYCMEYLLENIDWLEEKLADLSNDDYVLFDCPGQLELYTHLDIMNRLIKSLKNVGFSLCSVYLIDVTFLYDEGKFMAGVLMALSTMMSLSLPHITVLSKCDLISDKKIIKKFLKASEDYEEEIEKEIMYLEEKSDSTSFANKAEKFKLELKKILNDHNMVNIIQMNLDDEESLKNIILQADFTIQYGENLEPNEAPFNTIEETTENEVFGNMSYNM